MALRRHRGTARRCTALLLVAVSLAYVEAALVVYLREYVAPLRARVFPDAAREMLPLLDLGHLEDAGVNTMHMLVVELTREPAPLVLLAATAWGLRRRRGECLALFLIGFGVWDIFYYVFLKVLLGWPASLATWDLLYLIPTAWVAPVWAPVAVSATMIAAGTAMLLRAGALRAGRAWLGWAAAAAGAGVILASFLLRTPEAFYRVPERFDWGVFLAGWLLAVAGVAWALRPARPRRRGQPHSEQADSDAARQRPTERNVR